MTVLLASKTRSKILAFLFAHADEKYYVRELAALIQEDAGNLSRELRRLEEESVCRSDVKGRIKFYSLNKDYPLYSDLKSIFFKTAGIQGALGRLVQGYKGIETAFIYGSFARGSEKKTSDIDLIVIGKFNHDKFTSGLRSLETKLNREINFTSYTKEEFDRERKKAGGFLNILLKDKLVFLKGSSDDR